MRRYVNFIYWLCLIYNLPILKLIICIFLSTGLKNDQFCYFSYHCHKALFYKFDVISDNLVAESNLKYFDREALYKFRSHII